MTDQTRSATPFQVAALQMVSTPDVARNLAEARRLIAEAAGEGAQLVLLPEYFCFMGHRDTDKLALAEPYQDGPIQRFLAEAARRHGVWVIGGTLPLKAPEPDRVLNTTLVFDPSGNEAARYDKIHLFNFEKGDESFDEARTIRAGDTVVAFDAPFGRVGLSVCYDLRFPELYRRMGDCTLIVVPSAFYVYNGPRALGNAAARTGRREPVLRARGRARRQARERPTHLGPQHADRPVGRDRRGPRRGRQRRARRDRSAAHRGRAPEPARVAAPRADLNPPRRLKRRAANPSAQKHPTTF